MALVTTAAQRPESLASPDGGGTPRLSGWRLTLARAAWLLITASTLILDAIGVPATFAQSMTPCSDPTGLNCAVNPAPSTVEYVQQIGLPLSSLALLQTGFMVLAPVLCAGLGILIFLRKSDELMALFASIMLVTFGGASFSGTMQALPLESTAWVLSTMLLNVVGQVSFVVFFYVFPNGRFVPSWTRWAALLWSLAWLCMLFPGTPAEAIGNLVRMGPLFILFTGSLVVAQVYRYRRVSNSREREQTKWVVYGFSIALTGFLATIALGLLPGLADAPLGDILSFVLIYTFLLCIPVSIAIAILRSRLYDIDVVINRTLVYGSLTALLALIYWSGVALLQGLLRPLVGEGNDLAVVVTTLLIAALFLPLRRGIQRFIDSRFYRRKYDAARTLAAFGQVARDEMDLSTLTDRLVGVVHDTMQPEHVTLWLYGHEQRKELKN